VQVGYRGLRSPYRHYQHRIAQYLTHRFDVNVEFEREVATTDYL
jgi:hypothetical protein